MVVCMTRNSKRNIERRIGELEATIVTAPPSIELSDKQKEHLNEMVSDALEVLTDVECARLDELAEQIESGGSTDRDPPAATEPYPDPTPAEKEFYDLIFGVAPRRQLERRMG